MKELELFNCKGLACVSLKNYNDALDEILTLNNQLEYQRKLTSIAIKRKNKYRDIIVELEKWVINNKHHEKIVGTLVVDYGELLYKLKELKENK